MLVIADPLAVNVEYELCHATWSASLIHEKECGREMMPEHQMVTKGIVQLE